MSHYDAFWLPEFVVLSRVIAMHDFRIARPADDAGLTFKVVELMWEQADLSEDEASYELSIEGATRGQRAIYACTLYLSEVNNGGHHQFFLNSTGMVWDDAITGFRLLRAADYEAILRNAVDLFPYQQPAKDRFDRIDELQAMPDKAFDGLDDQLYKLEKTNDIDAIFMAFINERPDHFFR